VIAFAGILIVILFPVIADHLNNTCPSCGITSIFTFLWHMAVSIFDHAASLFTGHSSYTAAWKPLQTVMVLALTAIDTALIVSTEKLISVNHIVAEGLAWAFGQTLAILVVFIPFWSVVEVLLEIKGRRVRSGRTVE
jgi:hypothetical protein